MMCFILVILFCCQSLVSYAQTNDHLVIMDAKRHEKEDVAKYQSYVKEAIEHKGQISAPFKKEIYSETNGQSQIKIKTIHQKSNIIIFVSFSMPKQSLEAYLSDAKKIHASVVIRGLIDNSFKKTFAQVSTLVNEAGGGGVELNPLLFKKFGIKAVPAVVILPNDERCLENNPCLIEQDFDVIYGDITLDSALKEIRDRGSVSKMQASESLLILRKFSHG